MEGADRCCGLGGTFNVYHYGSSMTINEAKSQAIVATGAQAVATGCPGCMMQLSDGLKQHGSQRRGAAHPAIVGAPAETRKMNYPCSVCRHMFAGSHSDQRFSNAAIHHEYPLLFLYSAIKIFY